MLSHSDPATGEPSSEGAAPAGKPVDAAAGAGTSTETRPEDAPGSGYEPDRPRRRLGEAYFALVCLIGLIGLNYRLGRMWQAIARPHFTAIFAATYDPFHYPPNYVSTLDAERIRVAVGSEKQLKEVKGKEEIDELVKKIGVEKIRSSRSTLVVYVNMHARLDEKGVIWLLPARAQLEEFLPAAREDRAVRLADLLVQIEESSYGKKLVFLDIMHLLAAPERGILDDRLAGDVKNLLIEQATKLQSSTTCVICACRGEEYSWTSPELGYSPFAFFVAKALENPPPDSRMLTVDALATEITESVNKWTRNNRGVTQHPAPFGAHEWSLRLPRAKTPSNSGPHDETALASYLQGKVEEGKPIPSKPYPSELLDEWRQREKDARDFDMPRYAPWALHLWDRSLIRAEQSLTQGGNLTRIQEDFPKATFMELVKKPKDELDRLPLAEELRTARGDGDSDKKTKEYQSAITAELKKPKKTDRLPPESLMDKPGEVLHKAAFARALENAAEELRGDEFDKLQYLVQLFLSVDKGGVLRKGSYLDQRTVDGLVALNQQPPGGDIDLPGNTLRALLVIACQRSALAKYPTEYAWIKDDAEDASRKTEEAWKRVEHIWKTQEDRKERRIKDQEAGDELGKRQSFEIIVKKRTQLRNAKRIYQEAGQKLPYLGDYLLSTPEDDKARWKEMWKTWEDCAVRTKELADFFAPLGEDSQRSGRLFQAADLPETEAELCLQKLEGYVKGPQGIDRYFVKSGSGPQSNPRKTIAPGEVTGNDYRRLEALLAYPWLDPEQRKALWELKVASCREPDKDPPSSDEPADDDRREQRRDYLLKMLELGGCRGVVRTLTDKDARNPRTFGVQYYEMWIGKIEPNLLELLKDDKKIPRADRMLRIYYAINETHLNKLAHGTSESPMLHARLHEANRLEQLELEAMSDSLDRN